MGTSSTGATRRTMRTEGRLLETLERALISAKGDAIDELVHHSDRGAKHVSIRYSERLTDAGITISVGTVGAAATTLSRRS
ncbi:MAG: hypothetical protein ACTH07_01565 [Microbacterium sp.]